jgi:hypothetical protein
MLNVHTVVCQVGNTKSCHSIQYLKYTNSVSWVGVYTSGTLILTHLTKLML